MEFSTIYYSQTDGKSEREGYPIIIGRTSYKMNELIYIWILSWFRGLLRLSEVEAWMLTSQSKWKSFVDLRCRNMEFQVEDCTFLKVLPWKWVRR